MAKKKRRNKKKARKPYKKRKYYKSRRNSRDYLSPEYVAWRNAIKDRDTNTCQWPGCLKKTRLQIHHIKTWAKYPSLRFVIANGITLCKRCHENVKGKEKDFETFFLKLLEWQMINKIKNFNKDRKVK